MPGLIAASGLEGWSYGGSILTFALPMLMFIFIASALLVVFTKPHLVPGHRYERQDGSAAVHHGSHEGAEGS